MGQDRGSQIGKKAGVAKKGTPEKAKKIVFILGIRAAGKRSNSAWPAYKGMILLVKRDKARVREKTRVIFHQKGVGRKAERPRGNHAFFVLGGNGAVCPRGNIATCDNPAR